MAETSDGIWTPDNVDKYRLVPQLAAMAETVQEALKTRANTYTGTAAQRISFTATAPPGAMWVDNNTSNPVIWVKSLTGWDQTWPDPNPPTKPFSTFMSSTHTGNLTAGVYDYMGSMSTAHNTNFGPFTYSQTAGTTNGSHLVANIPGTFHVEAWLRPRTSTITKYLRVVHNGSPVAVVGDIVTSQGSVRNAMTMQLAVGDRFGVQQYYTGTTTGPTTGPWTGLSLSFLG